MSYYPRSMYVGHSPLRELILPGCLCDFSLHSLLIDYIRIDVHVCDFRMYMYIYICMYACLCVCVCVCVCARTPQIRSGNGGDQNCLK
jgi:hypothetical protein